MRSMQMELMDKQDIRKMSAVQQARLGFEVLNADDRIVLKCMTCGHTWSPEMEASGHVATSDLVCPHKCNL